MHARIRRRLSAGLLVILGASPQMATSQQPEIEMALFRTLTAGGATAVDAVLEVDPRGLAVGQECAYHLGIHVRETTGSSIARAEWRRETPCAMAASSTRYRIVDSFSFAVGPGSYVVDVSIRSTDAERWIRVSETVESLSQPAPASDLYIAREIRWIDNDSLRWVLRKGGLGLAVEAALDIAADRPYVAYYVELYPPTSHTNGVDLRGRIRRSDGVSIIDFPLQHLEGVAVPRPAAGTIPLVGLPPGRYELEVDVEFAGSEVVSRSRPFTIYREPPSRPDVEDATAGAGRGLSAYFRAVPDLELDRFEAIVLWLDSEETREAFRSLSATGKRAFLARFFSAMADREDGEAALRRFLERQRFVERTFGPTGDESQRPGWRTDRGRVWMLRGAPGDRIQRPFPPGNSRPYEIWYYDTGPGHVYLFADEGGFGDYRLLYSTDPTIVSLPDWARRVGPAAVDELAAYYGIR